MQSCALLECDFNSGLKYSWSTVQDKVAQILALGFSRNEALEAIMVTDNKQVELVRMYVSAGIRTLFAHYIGRTILTDRRGDSQNGV